MTGSGAKHADIYSHMQGLKIEGQERGCVLYSGPTQAVCTGYESTGYESTFTFIKIHVSGGIGGRSRSGPSWWHMIRHPRYTVHT